MSQEIHPIGHAPPLGQVPARMYAQVIREDRFGNPLDAFRVEEVDVPSIGRDECLVLVMAAGINYNGIWATRGSPVNLVRLHQKHNDGGPFHIVRMLIGNRLVESGAEAALRGRIESESERLR